MQFCTQTIYALASLPGIMAAVSTPLVRRGWIKNAAGRYTWANEPFAADLGCRPPDLIGYSTEEVWPQCWREIVRIDRMVITQRSDVVGHREELVVGRGEVIDVAVTRCPLVDANGVVVGIAGFYDAAPLGELARRHERQLMLAALTPEGHEFVADGMRAFAEEFSG